MSMYPDEVDDRHSCKTSDLSGRLFTLPRLAILLNKLKTAEVKLKISVGR